MRHCKSCRVTPGRLVLDARGLPSCSCVSPPSSCCRRCCSPCCWGWCGPRCWGWSSSCWGGSLVCQACWCALNTLLPCSSWAAGGSTAAERYLPYTQPLSRPVACAASCRPLHMWSHNRALKAPPAQGSTNCILASTPHLPAKVGRYHVALQEKSAQRREYHSNGM